MPYYDEEYKEVRFDIYCSQCVREKEPESDDKCQKEKCMECTIKMGFRYFVEPLVSALLI